MYQKQPGSGENRSRSSSSSSSRPSFSRGGSSSGAGSSSYNNSAARDSGYSSGGSSSGSRSGYSGGGSSGGYSGGRSGGYSSGGSQGGGYRSGSSSTGSRGGYSSGGRGGFSGGRSGGFGGGRSGGKKGNMGAYIDPAKFVSKAVVITEETVAFAPEHKFADFKINDALKQAILAKGYNLPTPIQDRAIPHVLAGQDVVGIAQTGTGKTAAFLIPLINKILGDMTQQVLIMVPTRELAIQIDEEFRAFAKGMKLFSVVCVGGMNIGPQLRQLKYRNHFVIGTPGRIKDHIERGTIRVPDYKTIVLDEADRMLDMGFIHDMRAIMREMPKPRHTLFFSATLSHEIEALISEFLTEPVRIKVSSGGETARNVDQDVVRVTEDNKLDTLHELLADRDFSKVIVFGRTKHGVEKLSHLLNQRGFKTDAIHGNKSHSQRQRALNLFKDSRVQVLVATDVAARGLDIADVSHVINYDLPMSYDDYVHRIGRTGRGNKTGKALTFIK